MDQNNTTKSAINCKEKIKPILDAVIHVLILILVCIVIVFCCKYYRYLLTWHAIFGIIGVGVLMSEALILLSNNVLFKNTFISEKRNNIHAIIFAIGGIFMLISIIFAYCSKNERHKKHFYTWHGVTGLVSLIIVIITGILGLFINEILTLPNFVKMVVLKLIHRFMGVLGYGLGILSICCSFYSNWVQGPTRPAERIVLIILTVNIAVLTLKHACKSMYNQIIALRT